MRAMVIFNYRSKNFNSSGYGRIVAKLDALPLSLDEYLKLEDLIMGDINKSGIYCKKVIIQNIIPLREE